MTGSDWRQYEIIYDLYSNFSDYIRNVGNPFEIGFWFVFLTLKVVFSDFFIVIGLLKILYLHSLIKFLKSITDNWITSVVILLPMSLAFMLIDNPLRFMVALIFVNYALYFYFQGKRKIGFVFLLASVLFHTTCIIIILMFMFFSKFTIVLKVKSWILMMAYVAVLFLFSDGGPVGPLLQQFQTQMILLGAKDYASYTQVVDGAFLTLGSFLNIFLFFIFLQLRSKIVAVKFGDMIFSCAVLYSFVGRVLMLVPTGFRLAIPLGYFLAIAYATVICKYRFSYYGKILLIYFFLLFGKKIWTSYPYIPYSNSIPYILTTHKPYLERSEYNIEKYRERFGKYPEGH